jgi:hypothetical protein
MNVFFVESAARDSSRPRGVVKIHSYRFQMLFQQLFQNSVSKTEFKNRFRLLFQVLSLRTDFEERFRRLISKRLISKRAVFDLLIFHHVNPRSRDQW